MSRYAHDRSGDVYQFLNMVCEGTTLQIVAYLRQGKGMPSSSECLDALMICWVAWAGWPKAMKFDRGLHNRGVFAKTVTEHGVKLLSEVSEEPPLSLHTDLGVTDDLICFVRQGAEHLRGAIHMGVSI